MIIKFLPLPVLIRSLQGPTYLILQNFQGTRFKVSPRSHIDFKKAIKNPVEVQGLRNAHLRDGAAYVRFLAWLEDKLAKKYEVTEYEAAQRLKEYRSRMDYYEGLAYETISATGKNAALPHYTPRKSEEVFIERSTPYLK